MPVGLRCRWGPAIGFTYDVTPKVGIQVEYAYRWFTVEDYVDASAGLLSANHKTHQIDFNMVANLTKPGASTRPSYAKAIATTRPAITAAEVAAQTPTIALPDGKIRMIYALRNYGGTTVTAATDLVCYGLTFWEFHPLVERNGTHRMAPVAGPGDPTCPDKPMLAPHCPSRQAISG